MSRRLEDKKWVRITKEQFEEDGVLTFYEDGTVRLEPWQTDLKTGMVYSDLFPNDHIDYPAN